MWHAPIRETYKEHSADEPKQKKEDAWSKEFLEALGAWDEPIERPEQIPVSKLRDPFGER